MVALGHAAPLTAPDSGSALGLALEFSGFGAEHIVLGYDHILFLLGLAVLCHGLRDVARLAGLFADSYSATLVGGTVAGLAVPGNLVDAIIALSVAFVGAQIAFGDSHRWLGTDPRGPALVFGLAHGLGLSSLLQELRLPGDRLLPSVLGFNVGVEVGQVAVLLAFVGVLHALRAFPLPARQRIPTGCALLSAATVFLGSVMTGVAIAHGPPVAPEQLRVPKGNLIPKADRDSYVSRVTAVSPRVPGLRARVLGHQELLELTWRGAAPLVVVGRQGEPMFRVGRGGVEVNRHSPTAWESAERFARLRVPDYASPRAVPRWEPLAGPGPWRWNEHRAQWMTAKRPAVVGDGATRRRIADWTVPVRIRDRTVRISGTLEWLPDAHAAREQRTGGETSPLLSLAIVLAAMAVGAVVGVGVRDRPRPER